MNFVRINEKILPRVTRVRGLTSLRRLAKNMWQPAFHPLHLHVHLEPVEKKIAEGKLPEEINISKKPRPSTSRDYSSSSDSESFEDDEASRETCTIVDRNMLNHVLEQSVTCRFCVSDSENLEVASTGLGAEWSADAKI